MLLTFIFPKIASSDQVLNKLDKEGKKRWKPLIGQLSANFPLAILPQLFTKICKIEKNQNLIPIYIDCLSHTSALAKDIFG